MSASSACQQLLWRGTFIDDWADAAVGHDLPARAHSEPPVTRSTTASSVASELFGAEREYLEALPARVDSLLSQPVSGEVTPNHWACECNDSVSISGTPSISTTASVSFHGMERQEALEGHWASESDDSASTSSKPSMSTTSSVPAHSTEHQEALEAALAVMQSLPTQLEEDLRQQGWRAARLAGERVRGLCAELLASGAPPEGRVPSAAPRGRQARLCHPGPTEAGVHGRSGGRHKAGRLPKVAATHGRRSVDRPTKDLAAGQARTPEFVPTASLTAAAVAKTEGIASPAQHAFGGPAVEASLPRAQAESTREVPSGRPSTANPGSIGHPYLCTRPCVFFLRNACANGSECNYCHLEVDGRGNHLDKMGREQFRGLDFPKRVQLAMPSLRQRAAGLGCPGLRGFLDGLEASAEAEAEACSLASTRPWPSASARHKLHRSLHALSFRAVLTHVCRGEDTPARLRGNGVQDLLSRVVAGQEL